MIQRSARHLFQKTTLLILIVEHITPYNVAIIAMLWLNIFLKKYIYERFTKSPETATMSLVMVKTIGHSILSTLRHH